MASSHQSRTPTISAAEWEVMKVLWEQGPLAAREVYGALPKDHGWAIKTVKSLLSRLAAKGAVSFEAVGNSYLYRAAVARDQVTRREIATFVDRVLGGSPAQMLLHFIEADGISDEEAARLQQLLEARRTQADQPRN